MTNLPNTPQVMDVQAASELNGGGGLWCLCLGVSPLSRVVVLKGTAKENQNSCLGVRILQKTDQNGQQPVTAP